MVGGSRRLWIVLVALAAAALLVSCDRPTREPKERAKSVERLAGPAGSLYVNDGGGGGLPVLFTHSFAGSSAHWSAQLDHLRSTRRAIAFDFRAHGKSTPSDRGDYSIAAFAQDIEAVVNGTGVDRFVLVGHSLGAAAAIAYAGKHPDRVAGLLLVGPPAKVPPEQSEKIVRALEADYDKVMQQFWSELLEEAQPKVRTRIASEMLSVPRDTSLAIIKALFADDPLPALRRYPGPKLLVATARDDSPNDLHRLAPDLPHQLIAGTSHWPQMDKPEEFNRLMDEFLARVR